MKVNQSAIIDYKPIRISYDNLFRLIETEVWNFDEESQTSILPTLPNKDYIWGIGLFIVNFTFCENMNQKMKTDDVNVTRGFLGEDELIENS